MFARVVLSVIIVVTASRILVYYIIPWLLECYITYKFKRALQSLKSEIEYIGSILDERDEELEHGKGYYGRTLKCSKPKGTYCPVHDPPPSSPEELDILLEDDLKREELTKPCIPMRKGYPPVPGEPVHPLRDPRNDRDHDDVK